MSDPYLDTLECPLCGDDAATADANHEFYDGQPLECGCQGHVSVDEDGVEVFVWDEPMAMNQRAENVLIVVYVLPWVLILLWAVTR